MLAHCNDLKFLIFSLKCSKDNQKISPPYSPNTLIIIAEQNGKTSPLIEDKRPVYFKTGPRNSRVFSGPITQNIVAKKDGGGS